MSSLEKAVDVLETIWNKHPLAKGAVWLALLTSGYLALRGIPVWPAYLLTGFALALSGVDHFKHWVRRMKFLLLSSSALGFGMGRVLRTYWPDAYDERQLLFNFAHWAFCLFTVLYLFTDTKQGREFLNQRENPQ